MSDLVGTCWLTNYHEIHMNIKTILSSDPVLETPNIHQTYLKTKFQWRHIYKLVKFCLETEVKKSTFYHCDYLEICGMCVFDM